MIRGVFFTLLLLLCSPFAYGSTLASGTVVLGKGLEKSAAGIKTLFIVIYDLESKRPMPYGAIKYDITKPPQGAFHKFELTTKNIRQMMPAKTPTKMRIKARLDRDGSAGMDRPGDIVGEVKPIKAGSKGVKIILTSVK